MSSRLTRDEWNIIYNCLAFVEAGEVDGGPLSGDTEEETERNIALLASAKAKLDQCKF